MINKYTHELINHLSFFLAFSLSIPSHDSFSLSPLLMALSFSLYYDSLAFSFSSFFFGFFSDLLSVPELEGMELDGVAATAAEEIPQVFMKVPHSTSETKSSNFKRPAAGFPFQQELTNLAMLEFIPFRNDIRNFLEFLGISMARKEI